MTKAEFMKNVAKLYRVGNMSDSDNPERPDWVRPEMAGKACCATLDTMMHELVACGALTSDEMQAFYDTL